MNKWRPKGWRKGLQVRDNNKRYTSTDMNEMFEAGADAMLEAILKIMAEADVDMFIYLYPEAPEETDEKPE